MLSQWKYSHWTRSRQFFYVCACLNERKTSRGNECKSEMVPTTKRGKFLPRFLLPRKNSRGVCLMGIRSGIVYVIRLLGHSPPGGLPGYRDLPSLVAPPHWEVFTRNPSSIVRTMNNLCWAWKLRRVSDNQNNTQKLNLWVTIIWWMAFWRLPPLVHFNPRPILNVLLDILSHSCAPAHSIGFIISPFHYAFKRSPFKIWFLR